MQQLIQAARAYTRDLMNRSSRYGFLPGCLLFLFSLTSAAQTAIQNKFFIVQPGAGFSSEPSFTITHRPSGIKRTIVPRLQLVFTENEPALIGVAMDGQPGIVGWKMPSGQTSNIQELGNTTCIARSFRIKNNQLEFSFAANGIATVSLVIKFVKEQQSPVIELGIEAIKKGNFSIGFDGMPEVDSAAIDFLYQPLTWSWKRFPSRFALTEEAYANTAAVFTNHHNYSEGLAVSLTSIPYRYALAAQWNNAGKPDNKFWSVFPADGPRANSLFGLAIRNAAGKAQPVIYAPLPGTETSRLNKGEKFKIELVYLLHPGNWQAGTSHLLSSIFHYRNERENAQLSLNSTLDNMLDFAMHDVYSGWNETLKGSNYQFDVPGTVKNVSALHPLSIALITGSEEILKRRAIPMIEYVMSREKFLFSPSDSAGQAQVPSHLLNGPCVDIGELVALHELTGGQTPAFAAEANRIFGKSRQLNMNTQTGGGSWQDYLARYRLYKQAPDLQKAVIGANEYLEEVYSSYSHTFFDTPGLRDKGAGFTTDYGYRIYDLFELFIATRDSLYLRAATTGAKQFLLWTRSNPAPPASNITVNSGNKVEGIFPGRRKSAIEGSPFVKMNVTSILPQLDIPAWQTSLNGLIPEAPNTYAFGPVMLAHHAAWLLQLAHITGDTLLRDAAYNAVIGRYANFPGYYFTSLKTNVYQRADYPMHPFEDVKYNAIFYNHVWPHLALLVDFLVSDFNYRSRGSIHFPGTYAPGYAFLTSQVYGAKKGTVMGNTNVQLWMPPRALSSDGVAFNYIMGYNEQAVFISFANTSGKGATEEIQLNRDIIPWSQDKIYRVIVYDNNGNRKKGTMENGQLRVSLPPGATCTIQLNGIHPIPEKAVAIDKKPVSINRFIRYTSSEDSTARITAMVIQPTAAIAVFYAYSNKTEKEWSECSLRYRINNSETWTTVSDKAYPFEFDLLLPEINDSLSVEFSATQQDGKRISYPVQLINH